MILGIETCQYCASVKIAMSRSFHSPGLTDSVRYVVVADGDNREDIVELVPKMRGLVPFDPVPVPLSVGGGEDQLLAMPGLSS